MNFEDRITYDSAELIHMLESSMDGLRTFHYDRKYRELLGEKLINKLISWDNTISRQKDSPLTLVVCGEFKRGKSSLINAILGEDVVTTNITTETITTNRISYGSHSNEIVMSGGKRLKLSDDELQCDKLREILKSLPKGTASLEIKRPIEMLRQLTIIDTPGLGDAMQDYSADVAEALRQADAVIYVFSVLYPLSMQEQMFIRSVIKPQQYTDLFLVANYCDIGETVENCERMKQVVCDRIEDVMRGETPIMLSALDERCRQLGARRPCGELEEYLGANFDEFRESLSELLQSKKDMIIPDRIQRLIIGMTDDISSDIEAMYEGLSEEMDVIKSRNEARNALKESQTAEQKRILETISDKINLYKAQSMEWFTKLIKVMEADAQSLNNFTVDDIKRYYPLYCVDTLQEAFEKCMSEFVRMIYDEIDNISSDISKKLSFKSVSSANFRFSLNNKSWTSGDNVAFLGSAFDNVMGTSLLGFGTSVIGGIMRQRDIKDSKPDLAKEILEQYPELLNTALSAVSAGYDDFADKAIRQVEEYFADRINSFDEQAEQAEMVARQDMDKKEEIRAALDEISSILEKINSELSIK